MCKNEFFQSSGTKIEFLTKFRDKNNNLTFINLHISNHIYNISFTLFLTIYIYSKTRNLIG